MKPQKKGLSLGSIVIIIILIIVLFACIWLFPKLFGDLNTRINPEKISKTFVNFTKNSLEVVSNSLVTNTKEPDNQNIKLDFSTHSFSEPTPTPILEDEVVNFSILFTGNVNYDKKIQKATLKNTDYFDTDAIFLNIKKYIDSDINVLGLSNTFVDNESLSDINAPVSLISSIKNIGINTINHGNNNSLNYGLEGIQSMLSSANYNNIVLNGIDAESYDDDILIQNVKNIPVAFLHYTQSLSKTSKKKIPEQNWSYHINIISEERVRNDILKAKEQGALFVVVTLDWEKSTGKSPSKEQINVAQYIAEAGANIIIANNQNNPLILDILNTSNENILSRNVPIAYSLGNLISSNANNIAQASSIMLKFDITYNRTKNKVETIKISYIPLYIWKNKVDKKDNFSIIPIDFSIDAEDKKHINFKNKVEEYLNELFGILPITVVNN
ncbi:MAG: CapA family protein [Christensenellaceae bacterium]|nr:CapA family protein [Christensenellaceae bacterium]